MLTPSQTVLLFDSLAHEETSADDKDAALTILQRDSGKTLIELFADMYSHGFAHGYSAAG